jgi:hypothetical protein
LFIRYLHNIVIRYGTYITVSRIRIRDPGCNKFVSGINVPDPQTLTLVHTVRTYGSYLRNFFKS